MLPKPIITRAVQPVPIEFAGKWVAWNSDHSQIVAQSEHMQELWKAVLASGISNPIFEKVPRERASQR